MVEPDAPSASMAKKPSGATPVSKWKPETSISLGGFGQFTKSLIYSSSSSTGVENITSSAGVLGTFRQSFRPWLGYSVNMGYTRVDAQAFSTSYFAYPGGAIPSSSHFHIPAHSYELSLSHIAQAHLGPKLTGFTEIGAGMLAFLPVHRGANALSYQDAPFFPPPVTFRPLGIFSAGVEYHFNPQWGLRGQFRGQMYKHPDFGGLQAKDLIFTAQPTVSLTYTFGAKKTYRR